MGKLEIVKWIVMVEQACDLLMICDEHNDNQLWFDVSLCVWFWWDLIAFTNGVMCVLITPYWMIVLETDWWTCDAFVCDWVGLGETKQIHPILIVNSFVCVMSVRFVTVIVIEIEMNEPQCEFSNIMNVMWCPSSHNSKTHWMKKGDERKGEGNEMIDGLRDVWEDSKKHTLIIIQSIDSKHSPRNLIKWRTGVGIWL